MFSHKFGVERKKNSEQEYVAHQHYTTQELLRIYVMISSYELKHLKICTAEFHTVCG